jgi:hypothetical protein
MQHKIQLGGNRFISKVRVFKPDIGSLPYMLFYADGMAAGPQSGEERNEVRVFKRSDDGKNILREYVLRLGI